MGYINVGATYDDGEGNGPVRVATKTALRKALKENPGDVVFDVTTGPALLPEGAATSYRGSEVPEGVTLSVVGPDPFTNRKWYASVQIRNGKATVTV